MFGDSGDDGAHLSAKLEAALLREVAESYRQLALLHFRGALRLPQFELVGSRARLGRWCEDTRVIELSRNFGFQSALSAG